MTTVLLLVITCALMAVLYQLNRLVSSIETPEPFDWDRDAASALRDRGQDGDALYLSLRDRPREASDLIRTHGPGYLA